MNRPRVLAHMVTLNEEHRYLQSVLWSLTSAVSIVHVYDDRSEDGTAHMAFDGGAVCTVRDAGDTPFVLDEGRFRQDAWDAFEILCQPKPGDWVLAIDADEFLVGADQVGDAIAAAQHDGKTSVVLPIPEVWQLDEDGMMHVRTDGWWGGLCQPRLFAYQPGGQFRPATMACGSVPTYAATAPARVQDEGVPAWMQDGGVKLAHLGYVDPADRKEKFARYFNRPGHSQAHVASILNPPTLRPWCVQPVWRGART